MSNIQPPLTFNGRLLDLLILKLIKLGNLRGISVHLYKNYC